MKNFREKWLISASNGILGKIVLVTLGVGVGFIGKGFISMPIDSDIIRTIFFGFGFLLFMSVVPLRFLLLFFADRRESDIDKMKLENENLKLKLELQQQNQQHPPNNEK